MYIKLDDLIPFTMTGIGNGKLHLNFIRLILNRHLIICKAGIGQAISKRIQNLSVKILIGPFALNNIVIVNIRQIFILPVPGHGKACRRIYPSAQYCRNTVSKLLRAGCRVHDGLCPVLKLHNRIRIIGHQNNDCIRIDFQHLICQPLLCRRKSKCRTVNFLLAVNDRI